MISKPIAFLLILALGCVTEGGYIWYLSSRLDELRIENSSLRDREAKCLTEQQGLVSNFETTIQVLNEKCKEIDNQLKECRGEKK